MALSECATVTDENSREINSHGTEAFPVACYHDDLQIESVPWHWHDEWEAVVVECGETKVSIGQEEHTVKAGDGFFINSGILHGCWNDRPEESCLFHSIVFSPSPSLFFLYAAPSEEGCSYYCSKRTYYYVNNNGRRDKSQWIFSYNSSI